MKDKLEEAKKDLTVDDVYNNLLEGLEVGIKDLQGRLTEQVDALSQKQLRRCLKSLINYPEEDLAHNSERETKFVTGLYTLHQMQVQLEIQVIGQLQKEMEEKESKNGNQKE
jgi:hypothetical protein